MSNTKGGSVGNINWYPGHMKKTRELIQENLKLVDLVIEVIDGRIPVSSRNPIIDELVSGKDRIIVLNKSDLSDEAENRKWEKVFLKSGALVISLNCMKGAGVNGLIRLLEKEQNRKNEARAVKKPLRMMIVGVPNVGKSSLINRLTGKKSAQTGDRPGVTRGKQWLSLKNGMQLLDTPGILWPKFEDPETGLNLAFCGSIKDEIMDTASLALELIGVLSERYPQMLCERYGIDGICGTPLETMESICLKRGFIRPGKRMDYDRCARTVLDEFRSAKIGRITLEPAPVAEEAEAGEDGDD